MRAHKSDAVREVEARARLLGTVRYAPPPRSSAKVDGRFVRKLSDEIYPKRVIGPSGIQRKIQGPPVLAPAKGLPSRDGLASPVAFYGGATLTVPRVWGEGSDANYLRENFAEVVAARSTIGNDGKVRGGGYAICVPSTAEATAFAWRNLAGNFRLIGAAIRDPESARLRYNAVAPGAKINRTMPVRVARTPSDKAPDPFGKAIDPGRSVKATFGESDIERKQRLAREIEAGRVRHPGDRPILCDARNAPPRRIFAY